MSGLSQIMSGLSQNYEWYITKLFVDYYTIMSGLSQSFEGKTINHD
jgi:hypothetical protein